MRFRMLLAGLLTVLMLSLSSVAFACEAKCDLAGLSPSCHGHATRSEASQAPEMSGMSMPGMVHPGTAAEHTVLQAPSTCAARLLSYPALCKDETLRLAQVVSGAHAIVALTPLLWSMLPDSSSPVRVGPPALSSTPVSLHTSLRI